MFFRFCPSTPEVNFSNSRPRILVVMYSLERFYWINRLGSIPCLPTIGWLNSVCEGKRMDSIKKFWRDESGSAEAASSAILIAIASGISGIWNAGLPGIWNSLINNPSVLILVVLGLLLGWWIIFKAWLSNLLSWPLTVIGKRSLISLQEIINFPPPKSVYSRISFGNSREYDSSNQLNRSAYGTDDLCRFATFGTISKPTIGSKARRNSRMDTSKIKREIVAVFMESPFYFTIPLKKRLEFIMFFSQKPVYNQIVELNKDRRAGKRNASSL